MRKNTKKYNDQSIRCVSLTLTSLKIKAFTWSKDSHGLFDYESSHLTIHRGFCRQNLQLYRSEKDVVFLDPKSDAPTPDLTNLCNIDFTEDGSLFLSF